MNLAEKVWQNLRWLPPSVWHCFVRQSARSRTVHLIVALADHFEPSIRPDAHGSYATESEQRRRLKRWCKEYPVLADPWRDDDGQPFRHTYFYPAEQYDRELIDRLAEHCRNGWGEIEIHLHHGVREPDTSENTRRILCAFRDALVKHGCLSRFDGNGLARYAFVHGNWALANSADGSFCGVDSEMEILAETGCYADFTLPSAPSRAQVGKINSLYECTMPLNTKAPHRHGRDLQQGRPPTTFPLIIQGPLRLSFVRRGGKWLTPRIENSAVTTANPPTLERLRLWRQMNITVRGRSDWVFIKLHCHGMDPRDEAAMLGAPMREFLKEITSASRSAGQYVHFVTAREMVNIILAACDGRDGNPSDYRNYRLKLLGQPSEAEGR